MSVGHLLTTGIQTNLSILDVRIAYCGRVFPVDLDCENVEVPSKRATKTAGYWWDPGPVISHSVITQ